MDVAHLFGPRVHSWRVTGADADVQHPAQHATCAAPPQTTSNQHFNKHQQITDKKKKKKKKKGAGTATPMQHLLRVLQETPLAQLMCTPPWGERHTQPTATQQLMVHLAAASQRLKSDAAGPSTCSLATGPQTVDCIASQQGGSVHRRKVLCAAAVLK